MSEITTRRALEVCLARLPMTDHARDTLARHLSNEIRKSSAPSDRSSEALLADMQRILDEASGVNVNFSKAALFSRFEAIRAIARGEA